MEFWLGIVVVSFTGFICWQIIKWYAKRRRIMKRPEWYSWKRAQKEQKK